MIRTIDLIGMIREIEGKFSGTYKDYLHEIMARLRAFDELKKGIKKLIATMSNEVDT